jgi:uncharacterized protein (TIGR00369 family)
MDFNLKSSFFKPALKMAMEKTGHGRKLGFSITGVSDGSVSLVYPYDTGAVGNPVTGVIHGGVIVSLLDTCCGCAAMSVMETPSITPTVDLRLDYMHPAEPMKPVYASGKVYKITASVIFCRGVAWQDDTANPIAHCVANFMRIGAPKTNLSGIFKAGISRMIPWAK